MAKKVNLQLTGPAVASDGNAIQIDASSGQANLIFFQVAEQTDTEVTANSVAHIRLTTENLERLADSIQESLTKSKETAQKNKKQ